MAKYSDIKGFTVQTLSTDTVASQLLGGAWASANSSNTNHQNAGGAGTQTSALAYGSESSPYVQVEEYNGTNWTEVAELNVQGSRHGFGANAEAVLATGGSGGPAAGNTGVTNVESWDGSSWTEVGDLNLKREGQGGFGTYTAGLVVSGLNRGGTPSYPTNVESWNGTAWTEVNEVNQGRGVGGSFGLQTSGIFCGGQPAPANNLTESWDGTSWTEVADLNTNRGRWGGFFGTSNSSGLVCGGYPGPSTTVQAQTETWDGTSWTEVADLGTARYDQISSTNASTSSGLVNSGYSTSGVTITEEWDAPAVFSKTIEGQLYFNSTTNTFKETITDMAGATWASSTAINTARQSGGNAGTATSAIFISGTPTPAAVEEWNGSSWSEKAELNTARITGGSTGFTGTAAIYAGGEASGPTANVETWDGSSFTETTDTPVGTRSANMFGSSTASVLTGGATGSPGATSSTSLLWNGSSWTSITEMGTDRNVGAEAGISTLGIIATGGYDPGQTINNVEEWNGSAWTEVSEVNTARAYGISSIAASYDSYIICSGAPIDASPLRANTEFWNGSTWTELADLSSAARSSGGSGSSSASALIFGGLNPSATTDSFEWTADLANKTITSS